MTSLVWVLLAQNAAQFSGDGNWVATLRDHSLTLYSLTNPALSAQWTDVEEFQFSGTSLLMVGIAGPLFQLAEVDLQTQASQATDVMKIRRLLLELAVPMRLLSVQSAFILLSKGEGDVAVLNLNRKTLEVKPVVTGLTQISQYFASAEGEILAAQRKTPSETSVWAKRGKKKKFERILFVRGSHRVRVLDVSNSSRGIWLLSDLNSKFLRVLEKNFGTGSECLVADASSDITDVRMNRVSKVIEAVSAVDQKQTVFDELSPDDVALLLNARFLSRDAKNERWLLKKLDTEAFVLWNRKTRVEQPLSLLRTEP
jgi:hypothetical protein